MRGKGSGFPKFISYMIVFVLGFGACAYILRAMGYLPDEASSRAALLQTLTRQPPSPIINDGENPIADAIELAGKAVVNIDTVTQRRVSTPFDIFGMSPRQVQMGQGSGVIISDDGYILTNNHVVAGAQEITVRLADGKKYSARLMSRNSLADLAILKVNARNLPVAKLGDSDAIRVGDWVIAIGNPLGFGNTVTVGVVSATKRTNLPVGGGHVIEEAIQTDAAINRGNSGGALVNVKGEVIGINTAIFSTEMGQGNIGIGFAIPINYAKAVLAQLLEHGELAYLGVIVADLTGDLQTLYQQHGYKGKGAVVYDVHPESPAARAGLSQGDVILSIDDKSVEGAEDVTKIIQGSKVGQIIKVSIWRDGNMRLLGAKLSGMPQEVR